MTGFRQYDFGEILSTEFYVLREPDGDNAFSVKRWVWFLGHMHDFVEGIGPSQIWNSTPVCWRACGENRTEGSVGS